MLLVSTGFKILLFGPKSFVEIFVGGEIRLFASARAATANRAETSTPMAVIKSLSLGGPGLHFMLAGSNIIKPPADNWTLTAGAAGTALWWRLVAPGDAGGDSPTAPRIDGSVGVTSAPSDMTLATATFAAGDALVIDSFLYTIPPL